MKTKKIFNTIFVILALALVGCSNSISMDESKTSSSKKGRLIFSASARAASTIMPTGFDFENDSDLTFTLVGTLNETSQTLGTWSDDGDTKAYSAMSSDNSILVDTGDWSFRLSVTKDGSEVLYGNLTKTIVAGANTLAFGTLKEASKDDSTRDSTVDVAKGSVNLKLSFPSGKAKSATGSLYAVGTDKTEEESLTITLGDDTDSVTFTKSSVDAGTYIVAISLYTDDEKSYCTKYTALVVVAPGAESTSEQSLSSLNALYTITYELNGGTFAEGETITTSYTPVDIFTLPKPTKDYYTFVGWAKTEDGEKVYDVGEEISINENITLYALWTPITYTITYELNLDDTAEVTNSNDISYTVENKITLSAPTCSNNEFLGWYESADFTTSKIIGWNAGEKAENITLYAKWGAIVTVNNIVEKIKAMTVSETIKASGEFSIELIREINAALKSLSTTDGRSDVLVTLDLSDVTGLTELEEVELEEASSTNSNYSFYNCTNLAGIVLPDTITSVGRRAFSGCTSLESIAIPDSVTSIGDSAFNGCTSLESITIPDSVTSIGDWAFIGCTSLANITIPDSVTSIGGDAFSGCTSLESVEIPDSVTSIGSYAFYNCTSLASITIPDSVTSIGSYAFSGCTSLASITIPDSVTSIDYYAFYFCTSLTSITIPDSVTSIGGCAFEGCTSLESVIIGNGVTSLNGFSFFGQTKLKSIVIGNSVTSIGRSAFSGCTSLASIIIPDSVTSIGSYAFYNCTSLESITIPDSVTSIGRSAFSGCTSLESITIPDSVTSIGSYAFEACTSLESVTIGNSVTSIGDQAFHYCKSLTSITIPDSVTSIGSDAFDGYLENVTIGNGVTSLNGFSFSGQTKLKSIVIGNSVTSIEGGAFYGCTSLTSVTIGNSVTSIGSSAFNDCSSLTSITIGNSVTSIGGWAFFDCTSLSTVYYTGTLKQWLGISFENWCSNPCNNGVDLYIGGTKLTEAEIPDDVTSIGGWAFYGCTSLTSITIPDSVTSIGGCAFEGCTSLESVTIGNSVTSIGNYAFYGCTSLTSVTIGNSVTSIGRYAFRYCTNLTSVTFEDTTTWYYTSNSDYTDGTVISLDYLANSSTAATYLTDTYNNYYWYKK